MKTKKSTKIRPEVIKQLKKCSREIDNGKGKRFANAKALKLYLKKI